ncbi:MAG: LysR family transcriptional regulator, partial [Oscillospiraceae bacterium]|nr:LysR family transcriptional regulator [Oscillospiraceae bacterium]
MLDYRIETFLTLCDTMNYHAAAQILCITQPTVTQHIQYLEQHYAQKFFSYDGRRLRLTPQGQTFLRYAHSARYQEQKITSA